MLGCSDVCVCVCVCVCVRVGVCLSLRGWSARVSVVVRPFFSAGLVLAAAARLALGRPARLAVVGGAWFGSGSLWLGVWRGGAGFGWRSGWVPPPSYQLSRPHDHPVQ